MLYALPATIWQRHKKENHLGIMTSTIYVKCSDFCWKTVRANRPSLLRFPIQADLSITGKVWCSMKVCNSSAILHVPLSCLWPYITTIKFVSYPNKTKIWFTKVICILFIISAWYLKSKLYEYNISFHVLLLIIIQRFIIPHLFKVHYEIEPFTNGTVLPELLTFP